MLSRLQSLIDHGRFMLAEGDGGDGGGGDPGVGGGADTVTGGGGDGGGDVAPSWRDDWREAMAGGDEKRLAELKRFSTPESWSNAGFEARTKIRSGQYKQTTLPEGASEAEIAQYRKELGVPEAPEGYQLAFPEGVKASEADQADLAFFAKGMHDAHMPPAAVKTAFAVFNQLVEQAAQRKHEQLQEFAVASQAQLRADWGRDYTRNRTLTNEFLAEALSEANAGRTDSPFGPNMMEWQLVDGTKLGDNPAFARTMAHLAMKYSADDALVAGEERGGKPIDDQIQELVQLSATRRLTKAEDDKLNALYEQQVTRDQRRQARAA